MLNADDADEAHASETRGAGERIANVLIGRLDGASDADEIAAALVRSWIVIDGALGPILGPRGVAALYKRSLQLTSAAHPWMADLERGAETSIDLKALEAAFLEQTDAHGLAAARELLRALCNLMVSLVGVSLTERLLHPVLPDGQLDIPQETLR